MWKGKIKDEKLEKINEYDTISLSDEEQHALNQYISFEAYIINEKLRNGTVLNEIQQEIMKNLDSALKKMPYYNGNISRSLYFGDKSAAEDFVKKFKVGEKITFNEYISTTCSKEFYNPEGEVQILIINSKKGRDITSFNRKEKEVLYERNSKFKVRHIEEKAGTYLIRLEEIG